MVIDAGHRPIYIWVQGEPEGKPDYVPAYTGLLRVNGLHYPLLQRPRDPDRFSVSGTSPGRLITTPLRVERRLRYMPVEWGNMGLTELSLRKKRGDPQEQKEVLE